MRLSVRWVWVGWLLAGCATLPGTRTTLLHGGWVESAVAGQGGPVVVFESGLGADLRAWDRVFPAVARTTTAFAWSRPGEGASDPSPEPRTGAVVIEELRATLRARGLAPPYVLVGHSLGGLYLQLFARRYPEEVAGLVLVDSSHPARLAGARARPPITLGTTLVRLYMTGTRGREFRGLDETGQAVLALPDPPALPVTVLSAGKDPALEGRPPSVVEALKVDVARRFPASHQRWVDCGHNVPRERPDVIVEAISDLVSRAAEAR